jgi:hypothetical protein
LIYAVELGVFGRALIWCVICPKAIDVVYEGLW